MSENNNNNENLINENESVQDISMEENSITEDSMEKAIDEAIEAAVADAISDAMETANSSDIADDTETMDSQDNNEDLIINDDLQDEDGTAEDEEDSDIPTAPPHRKFVRYGIMAIALIIFIFSAVSLIQIFSEYKKGEDIYESINNAIFITETTSMVPEGTVAETTAYETVSYAEIETEYTLDAIDMAALNSMSPYAVGWIQIPAITRSYPIGQYIDNSYYLTHTFTGEENNAGSIFMAAENYPDFSDKNTIIYGHNMQNGTMFGMLNRFEDETFYEENNSFFYITTNEGIRAYEIFAICLVPSRCVIYNISFQDDTSFSDFLNYVDETKLYDTGVSVLPTDTVVTLSTCTSDSSTRRVVLGKYIGTIKN